MADVRDVKAEANRLIAYHGPISRSLTAERTSLESRLIPVTAYVAVACVEAWHRYPEIVERIDAAGPAEKLGLAGRQPGSQINTVFLWGFPNFYLLGRNAMLAFAAADDPERHWKVLDFWERAAMAFRSDGHRQAWDAEGGGRPYADDVLTQLVDGARPIGADDERTRIKRFNATLVNYLFLLYFDTRVGSGDTGPYPLGDGRVLLVRDYYRMSKSDFWWSDVAAGVPFQNLTAALVLDGVDFKITDFGTSYTDPEDYLDRLVGFGLFTTDTPDGSLRAVPDSDLDDIVDAVRTAQAAHYRNLVDMDRHEKIRCGAYVYFTFLRPLAEAAGVAGDIDWSVPRDVPEPLYELLSQIEGGNSDPSGEGDYYPLIP